MYATITYNPRPVTNTYNPWPSTNANTVNVDRAWLGYGVESEIVGRRRQALDKMNHTSRRGVGVVERA